LAEARIIIDQDYEKAKVNPLLFGSFIEHMGRAIYSGIYEPGHPEADEQGFRKDVIQLVRELGVPIVRYPGGNFLSGYRWTDGIGPKESRPTRLDLAWRSVEPNQVGIDEFVDWTNKVNTNVMAAVNLGTGTPQQAGEMVEYCNHPGGTYWSDLRKTYGHPAPHDIKVWCLGNEMDGDWQICHLSAEDYGKKALEAAKIMKWVDPTIELVACGSSGPHMATFPEWDRVILEYLYDKVDYVSLHRYYEPDDDINSFLASFVDMNYFIKTAVAAADYVRAKKRSSKTLYLSFDEWNIWYQKRGIFHAEPWQIGPELIEDRYTLLDALTLGGLLCTLLQNADRVKIACLAQLVNVIAPILTERGGRAVRQATYYPFRQVSRYARGTVLQPQIFCPDFHTNKYGEVPVLQVAAVLDENSSSLNLFILNCGENQLTTELVFRGNRKLEPAKHEMLNGKDLTAVNSIKNPNRVGLTDAAALPEETEGAFQTLLPGLSWNMIRFSLLG
jgi:alpha-N-arabinofuranosidase